MLISGLQKMTLLDYPGLVACTVFTGGCNFRCPFCHNAQLVLPDRMDRSDKTEQVLSFLRKRQGLLDGVAITGGEPLLHADMPDFLRRIRDLGYRIKLDTNGSFPDRLRAIVEEGLVDRVAMDIKNAPLLYAKTIDVPKFDLEPIERSKSYLLEGHVEYEFRTTVVYGLHTEENLCAAARWIEGAREYYLQQYQDSGDLISPYGLEAFTDEEMPGLLEKVREIIPAAQLRGLE